jgi:KDO2-lipid IV(A) lauroyltransferase
MRPVFTWLREGKAVMVTGDGTGTRQRLGRQRAVAFLGRTLSFPQGPALLAHKTGAHLLPLCILPGPDAATPWRVVLEPPLLEPGQEADAGDAAQAFARRLEARVREHPGWWHFLDRMGPGGVLEAEQDGEDRQGG